MKIFKVLTAAAFSWAFLVRLPNGNFFQVGPFVDSGSTPGFQICETYLAQAQHMAASHQPPNIFSYGMFFGCYGPME